ncbi:glycosyltransferase family 2 protein [Idiomarina abyssalis]|uniref:glycosyltransferase family 2 protein n=1 Tax=Idiomarina abyssalis TaxID=86102 RepID=UPI003A902ECF
MSEQSQLPKVSVYLITLNEGRHLDEVLASVKGADEILLVDSGSTDDTLSIAEKHGARIIHQDWLGYARQKAFALEQCRNDWVINLDGDEVLPEGAFEQIQQRIAKGDINGIYLAHDDIFMGHSLPYHRHHRFRRVYRKSKSQWNTSTKVHEHIEVEPPLTHLPIDVKHYGYDSAHGYMDKLNKYSLLKAKQREERGRHCSLARVLLIFPLMFIKFYFIRRMFLAGWRGFIKANIDAFHFFLTEAKLYERAYRRKRGDKVEKSEY